MSRLALLGASGHGKVVADSALAAGWRQVVFFDDAWPSRLTCGSWHVAGDTARLLARLSDFDGVAVAIGDCAVRWKKQQLLTAANARMATIIHPRCWVSPFAKVGAGSVVMAGAVINVDASIGAACIVNTGATVDHDCTLADAVHVSPGAHLSGNVSVADRSWIGVGACIRQGIAVGAGVTVGAGAVVVAPVAAGLTVVGCPAAPMRAP